jgi:hypothetical protein
MSSTPSFWLRSFALVALAMAAPFHDAAAHGIGTTQGRRSELPPAGRAPRRAAPRRPAPFRDQADCRKH